MSPNAPKRRKLGNGWKSEEEDISGGITDNTVDTPQPAVQPSHARKSKFAPSNIGEAAAYAAGESYSNLFKLQVDELLKEVQPSYEKKLSGVDEALHTLKNLIEGIDDGEPLSIPEASKILHKAHRISIPYPEPNPDKNLPYKLTYKKPSKVNVIGSYALKTMVKSKSAYCIDMIVVMPSSIFQEKDYLNYRYFYKRAFYLACIAAGLESNISKDCSYRYEYSNGNNLHPILVATFNQTKSESVDPVFEIRIIPAAPNNLFPTAKIRLDKNSIRHKDEPPASGKKRVPTPFYNSSLSSDCNFESYLKLLHTSTKTSSSFQDACILGRVWLRQRGFSSRIDGGGFGHFEWSAITALLLKGGGPKDQPVLLSGYSSYQMFKAVLQFIASKELASRAFIYQAADIVIQSSNAPIFYDGPRDHNILYKMSPWSYDILRNEAKVTLETLNNNDGGFGQFESTFILKISQPLLRFDCRFLISPGPKTLKTYPGDHTTHTRYFCHKLYDLLQQGLMERVSLIHIEEPSPISWSTKLTRPTTPDQTISVSVMFDPINIGRLVDHGPSAEESAKATKFRKFWGEKAELRRFKDGRILESLVWSPNPTYSLFESIVTYIISRHFDSETSRSLTFVGGEFEKLLPNVDLGLAPFEALREAFNTLQSQIHNIEGLPLQLRQLSALDSQLRYASVKPPLFGPGKFLEKPAEVLLQFEASGKWPDDLVAIQRTKAAFLLKISGLLEGSDGIFGTRVGLENESYPLQNCAFLDVIYQSGPVFRLRIHHDREQTLLEKKSKEKTITQEEREEAVSALSVYRKTCIQLPLLTQSISTHCTRFPLLSPTIRLVKLWFDSHMLRRHVSDELIELIVARTFLQPYPWQAPSSLMTAYLRTILFLSKWDWRSTPLAIDFSGAMTKDELGSVNTRLEAWRKIDPNLNKTVLVVASNHDKTGTAFSDRHPSKMIAARMTALARSACKVVKEEAYLLKPILLFTTSTSEYDFVLHLSKDFTAKPSEEKGKNSKFKNLEIQSEASVSNIGYEAVQLFLAELEALYSDHIIFFHNSFSGSIITAIWNPQSISPRSFKVNLSYSTKILKNKENTTDMIVINKPAILAEIARLGGDMVKRIQIEKSLETTTSNRHVLHPNKNLLHTGE
ncbi:U3 small nucleolar RNA-associated protein 22 [Podosphaera aphanis]|nr:U3 small nucleolar RNA-associated protein 22 [Podosphaera aphanis]